MSDGLAGASAIVTGGGSGIGEAIAHRLRRDGARVAVFDMRAAREEEQDHYEVNVTDDHAVREAVRDFASRAGGIDILVNNAGIGARGTVEDNSDEEWTRVFEVNVMGPMRVSRAVMPWLRKSQRASIVNVCSIAATAGLPQRALYGASKGAVLALTLQMAADHVGEGIRVNAVNPGTVETPWVQRLLEAADDPAVERAALEARQPHGRLVLPQEVADAVAYLVGDGAGSTTGVALAVDGGMATLRARR